MPKLPKMKPKLSAHTNFSETQTCFRRPNFSKPRPFSETKFSKTETFSETKFSETETKNIFRDQIFRNRNFFSETKIPETERETFNKLASVETEMSGNNNNKNLYPM